MMIKKIFSKIGNRLTPSRVLKEEKGSFNNKIIFLHIPKTAGTSLRRIVEDEYGQRNCAHIYNLTRENIDLIQEDLFRSKVIYGHLCYGVHKALGIQGRYITFLRNPVDRVISFYNHQARHEGSSFYKQVNEGMSLLEMLQGEMSHEMNNHQTRIISGYPGIETVDQNEVLDTAIANINNYFDFVGLAEQMEESVRLMRDKLNWTTQPQIPQLNVTFKPQMHQIDDETLGAIKKYNRLDILLYEHVKSDNLTKELGNRV